LFKLFCGVSLGSERVSRAAQRYRGANPPIHSRTGIIQHTNELIDGGLVLSGGLLLIAPGFVTDGLGLLLLFPPTRVLARRAVKNRFGGRVTYFEGLPRNGHLDGPDDVIDV